MSDELTYELLPKDFEDIDLTLKIILIGDSGVGKSCLTFRGINDTFNDFYSPTIGFEFFSFLIRINSINMKIQIWDTCGQEVYKSLIASFYRNSSLAIIVYAINDRQSYINVGSWINEIKNASSPDIKLFLIGNKCDLEESRQVSAEEGHNLSVENGFDYFGETSAKTGFNAQEIFIKAAKVLYIENKNKKNNIIERNIAIEENGEEERVYTRRKKRGCCK
jgi:small GTP-binding protein